MTPRELRTTVSESEIAEVMRALPEDQANVVRRLAYQRDRLAWELARRDSERKQAAPVADGAPWFDWGIG